jgi:hypothetical protein
VLGNEAARSAGGIGGIFDGHIPAAEVHHASAKLTVRGVESGLTDDSGLAIHGQ